MGGKRNKAKSDAARSDTGGRPGDFAAFKLDDPVLPAWIADGSLTSGGFAYDKRLKRKVYDDELVYAGPLFIHQFSHAWIDFRGKRERRTPFVDYFENPVIATRAQREFFINDLSREFPKYSANMWGLTASDYKQGYVAWGAPPRHPATDGSVVPCAPAGSLMFTPDITLATLKKMKSDYGDKIYGKYGFADAFNPHDGWVASDVLGIDLGITLLSIENLRSGKVWHWFMQNDEIRRALRRTYIY